MYVVLRKFEGHGGEILKPGRLVDADNWRLKTQLVNHKYIALTDRSTPPSPKPVVEAKAEVVPPKVPIVAVEPVAVIVPPKVKPVAEVKAVGKKGATKKVAKRGRPPLGKKGRVQPQQEVKR